jgi:hypothetical protein
MKNPESKFTNSGGKPGRSGPPKNQNNLKHGLYSLMAQRKDGKPNGRTAFGRAFKAREQEYVTAYGGDVSPMEMTLITDIVWHDFYVSTIDAEIAKGGLLNGGEAHPLLEFRPRFAAHRRDTIKILGLKRISKQVTLQEILSQQDDEPDKLAVNANGHNEQEQG